MENYHTHYEKIRIRKSLDFALVSLASAYKVEDGKMKDVNLVYGGVAPYLGTSVKNGEKEI